MLLTQAASASGDSRTHWPGRPSLTGTYGACWSKKTGELRLSTRRSDASRGSGARRGVSAAPQGKPGSRGVPGTPGEAGAQGPPGEAGATGAAAVAAAATGRLDLLVT